MERDFRIYLGEDRGFVTVRVIVKGILRKKVIVLPLAPFVKVLDVQSGAISGISETKPPCSFVEAQTCPFYMREERAGSKEWLYWVRLRKDKLQKS